MERNYAREFAEAIHRGVNYSNAKVTLQHISSLLSQTSISVTNVLPLMFTLDGQPYGLDRHFFFEPMFSSQIAANLVCCSGRQVGKSMTGVAAPSVAYALLIKNMRILTVTPLYEQVRRLSQNYVRPFIDQSPIRILIVDPKCSSSILQRDFLNGSTLFFSYAFTSVTRVRGISTYAIFYDELDDFDPEYPAIINQCAASAPRDRRFIRRFGTPKTTDTLMSQCWQASSQAEWSIRCSHCGHWNVPSLEQDLDAMIGPKRPSWRVCRDTPGIVCAGKQTMLNSHHVNSIGAQNLNYTSNKCTIELTQHVDRRF